MSPFPCPSSPSPLKGFTPCEGIQFAEFGKFWLVESGILGIVIRNRAQEIRNSHLSLESRIQFSLTKTGIQCAESGIQRLQIQNPGLSWIPSRETKGWPRTPHASYSVFCIAQIVTLMRQVYSSLIKACFVHVCSISITSI